jgi:hypothetical protein
MGASTHPSPQEGGAAAAAQQHMERRQQQQRAATQGCHSQYAPCLPLLHPHMHQGPTAACSTSGQGGHLPMWACRAGPGLESSVNRLGCIQTDVTMLGGRLKFRQPCEQSPGCCVMRCCAAAGVLSSRCSHILAAYLGGIQLCAAYSLLAAFLTQQVVLSAATERCALEVALAVVL